MENKSGKILMVCNAILFLGLIGIYILHFTSGKNKMTNAEAVAPVQKEGGLTTAYINTDTLIAKYQYAVDMEQELQTYKNQQERYYQNQITQYQTDMKNYLETGSTLTLSQQQAKEEELKKRQEQLMNLEQELMGRIAEKQATETAKIMNAILAYVREYNMANQQFDIVLNKSATLYINPQMDITDEIVNGLNEEYKEVKAKSKN